MTSFDLFKEAVKLLDSKPDLKKQILAYNKTFQFNILNGSAFYVEARGDELRVELGEKQPANATITASDQVLEDIFSGKLDGVQAFMQGKLKIAGDIFSVQKLSSDIMKARK
jgi:putative sterol carrier protein